MKNPVLLIQSISALVLGLVCLALGIGVGFSGADGPIFLIGCIALIAVGVFAFAFWYRKRRI